MKKTIRTIALIMTVGLTFLFSGCDKLKESTAGKTSANSGKVDYLAIVSKTSPMKEGAFSKVDLVTVDTVYENEKTQVEKKAYDAYLGLQASLKSKGIEIGIDSAYRSLEEQKRIMKDFTEKYGADYAKKTVAVPGTSEHQTGLAIDIVPKVNGKWVTENADMLELPELFAVIHIDLPKYGFILRYPYGKESITGYDYEPWHIRYIGDKKIAQKLLDEDLCLEEYFSN